MKKIRYSKLNEVIYNFKIKGLDVYVWENLKSHNVYAGLNVMYGSSNYRYMLDNSLHTDKTGIAHFLEHVLFNMPDGKNASEVFASLGTFDNAYTNTKNTCYHILYDDDHYTNLKNLIDMVYTPYFTYETIEKEKQIIVEEKRRSLNNVYQQLYENHMNNLFNDLFYKDTTLGTIDDIENLTPDDIMSAYKQFYFPANMQLVVCGNCNVLEIYDIVNSLLKEYKFNRVSKFQKYDGKEKDEVVNKKNIIYGNVNVPKLYYSFKFNRKKHFDKYTQLELDYIFDIILRSNFGPTNPFYNEIIKKQIAFNFQYYTLVSDDYFVINFVAETNNADRFVKNIDQQFKNIKVSKEDFVAKKNSMLASFITLFQDNNVVGDYIIESLIVDKNLKRNYNVCQQLKYSDVQSVIDNLNGYYSCLTVMEQKK